MATCGLFKSTSARPRRWRIPREKVPTRLPADLCKTHPRKHLVGAFTDDLFSEAQEPPAVVQIGACAQLVVKTHRVGQVTNPPFDLERFP